jgi:Cu(I)/Ag(I) efflux system membrane fusion protein
MKRIKSIALAIPLMVASQFAIAQTTATELPSAFKTSLQQMFTEYLELKDALMQGNPKDAAKEAVEINAIASKVNTEELTKDQLAIFNKQNAKILHNTEHIRDNSTNYDHQCEHFDYLTDEFYALLKSFKFNSSPVYYNYTKEGNEGNSAHWLTDKDEMKDPYFKGALKEGDKRIEVIN